MDGGGDPVLRDAFLDGDPAADFAPPEGVLDLADLTAFIVSFTGGCP